MKVTAAMDKAKTSNGILSNHLIRNKHIGISRLTTNDENQYLGN